MRYLFLLFLLFTTISCAQHPKEGDWYESRETGQRIKIELIDTGEYINSFCTENKERLKKLGSKLPFYIYYDSSNAKKQCICFSVLDKKYFIQRWYIISKEIFLQDYKLVE